MVAVAVGGVAHGQMDVDVWLSCDNEYRLYIGDGTGLTVLVGGDSNWGSAQLFNIHLNAGEALYVAAWDFGQVFGLGGYVSINSGPFDPILPGAGWVSYNPGSLGLPDMASTNALIAAADAGNHWVPAGPGTAAVGFGLPGFYGSLPALGCIWDPRAGASETVIFRFGEVPAPATVAPVLAGLAAFGRRRRSV